MKCLCCLSYPDADTLSNFWLYCNYWEYMRRQNILKFRNCSWAVSKEALPTQFHFWSTSPKSNLSLRLSLQVSINVDEIVILMSLNMTRYHQHRSRIYSPKSCTLFYRALDRNFAKVMHSLHTTLKLLHAINPVLLLNIDERSWLLWLKSSVIFPNYNSKLFFSCEKRIIAQHFCHCGKLHL